MGWQDAPVIDTAGGWQSAPEVGAPAAPAPEGPISWGDVPGQAASNFLPSLGGVLHDIAQPVLHPIDTATNLKNLTVGVLQKTGVVKGDDAIKYADAFGEYFKNRYGSEDGFKRALAKDPAGVLADASAILTGGETALARAPGLVGKAASVAGTVGRAVDPLNVVTKPLAGAVRAADPLLGLATGAGPDAIAAARQAGREGGAGAEAFTAQMRGAAPIEEIVTDARAAADQMKQVAQDRYVQDMARIGRNPTPLNFNDIDAALARADRIVTYEGRERRALVPVRDELVGLVNEWKGRDPAKFHTAAGLDELKKVIYQDVLGPLPFHGAEAQRKIAGDVYDAVKQTIVKQDKTYADAMKSYEGVSKQLREIEKALSLNPRASVDAALRKLTSSMRNNVNTNFGKRAQLVQQLQAAGAPQLTNKIAGASLNSWQPRGLAGLGALGTIGSVISGGGLPLATLAGQSPRLVGEAQRGLGIAQRYGDRLSRPMGPIPISPLESLRQLGRTRNINQQ